MNFVFTFKIKSYAKDEETIYTHTGVGFAESFTDAVSQIEDIFENELCEIMELTLHDKESLIFLPEKAYNEYRNEDFPSVTFAKKERK